MSEGDVRILFKMEGLEAAQQDLDQLNSDFGSFWNRMDAEAREFEIKINRSLSSMVAAFSAVTRVGMDVLEVFGVTIDTVLKETINLILSYATQLALIATSTSVINPAYAAALATIAATLQARAIQLQATGQKDAQAALERSRRLMSDLTQSIVIIART